MTRLNSLVLLLLLNLAACSSRPAAPAPPVYPPGSPEARLAPALEAETWGELQSRTIAELDAEIGRPAVDHLLRMAAADTTGTRGRRATAILQLGDREATSALGTLQQVATDRDPVLRAAVMFAVGSMIELQTAPVLRILAIGLRDEDDLVRAKALQSVGDREPGMLRDLLARDASPEIRRVALDLLNLAHQRGAPWADSATVAAGGELSRVTPLGTRLVFRPTQSWPQWNSAVGELHVAAPGGQLVRIATDVEVVGGVVPAMLSPEESAVAYESGRRIFVRHLVSGAVRELGPGIAPRPLPLSERFLFLLERRDARTPVPGGTRLRYEVRQATFDGAAMTVIGEVQGNAMQAQYGAYSNARLARIVERGDAFVLRLPGGGELVLPDPFGEPAGARK